MNKYIAECKLYCQELHILYVEDNLQARNFTMDMLKRFFKNITVAEDGEDGLKCFKNKHFDIVLTDINMPNMNGLEMAKEIKKIDNTIPILVLSANNEVDYFISAIKIGIDGYLLKPLEIHQFVETLYKTVEKIHLQKEIKLYQKELELTNQSLELKVKERTAELEHRLYHDKLTELGNHEAMVQSIDSSSFEVLFLVNINGFQKFNDIYGLDAGNTILKKISKLLQEFNSNNRYSTYRVYGDVFALYRGEEKKFDKEFIEDIRKI